MSAAIALARTLVAELVAAGVRDAVLAPGSRSAPLAYALSDAHDAGWLRLTVRIDERSAGFMALGMSRAGEKWPVAIVTTSGTAVANLHPAVLEAAHSGDPLIVISADRPHEWRGTGANQTTTQPGIFGSAVRWQADIPAGFDPAALRGLTARALAAATGALTFDPGPVHLNVGFAEPLVPALPDRDMSGYLAKVEHLRQPEWIAAGLPQPIKISPLVAAPVPLAAGPRTLLLAGDAAGPRWAELAEQAGWPLLAEPSSGTRLPGAILHYRDLLAAGLADEVERVVVVGHPTLSRPVSRLLARPDIEIVVVGGQRWTDVAGVASQVAPDITAAPASGSDRTWQTRWREADAALHEAIVGKSLFTAAETAAALVWESEVPALVLGSSNTIRAVDIAGAGRTDGAQVIANRGLAGIDGTIGTAHGLALGLNAPVRALVGDLTFLHDSSSLLRGEYESEVDLQVVVVNDHGGAIFQTLEPGKLASHDEVAQRVFDRVFRTPQRADIRAIAAGYEASYTRIDMAEENAVDTLRAALAAPIHGRSVIEVAVGTHDLAGIAAARAQAARDVVSG